MNLAVQPNGTGNITINVTGTSMPADTNANNTGSHTFVGTDFNIAAAPASASIKAGASATYQITLGPTLGSYGSPVSLTCSGAPANAQCTVSPASVEVDAVNVTATVSVTTAPPSFTSSGQHAALLYSILLPLFSAVIIASSRFPQRQRLFLVTTLLLAFAALPSCGGGTNANGGGGPGGGGSGSGTPPGTYSLMIHATSGADTKAASVSFTVQ